MIEGLDFTEEVDLDEEDEIDIHLQGEEEEEIDIHLKDDEEIDIHLHDEDEIIIDGDTNHGEEEAADLEVDIVPYEFHDDEGKSSRIYFLLFEKNSYFLFAMYLF